MMKRATLLHPPLFLAVILAFTHASYAQLVAGPGVTDASSSQPISNRTFSFSGTIPGQLDGALSVTFSIYPDQQNTTALWTETQIVQVAGEKYSVMLGSTSVAGLPPDIFSADQAHWLGVQVNGSEKRFLLVSVPYAMKAVEAERLGGLLPSDYVTVQQLQNALQSAAAPGTPTNPKATSTGPTGQAAAAGTPPQPAMDFTDNNTSEVLLVTQQGTGYAIHAVSTGDAALFAENSNTSGTALKVLESSSTGLTVGILAQTSSPEGIPAIFDNTSGQGGILRLQSNGNIVTTFSHLGDINTIGEILASRFNGDGSGLVNIPPSAINATPGNFPNSVVARDTTGSFSANQIFASNFSGSGAGLTNIPPSAVNATSINIANTVVARDATGSFNANQIFASTFSGSGAGLTNIPPSAVNATSINIANTLVARDGTGSFNANQIFASTFSGSGAGLTNIPPSAVNATSINIANTLVARDATGSFNANQVFANTFLGDGSGLFNIPPSAVNATPVNIANTLVARDASGSFNTASINVNNLSANAINGTAIQGSASAVGIQASTQSGFGLWAGATANDSTGTALLLSHASQGKLIDGGVSLGSGTNIFETFSVTAEGDITFNGAMMTPYETTGTWFASSLVKLTSVPGNFGAGTVAMTSPGDTSGVVGIISGLPASGSRIQVVQSGEFTCNFDGPATSGHYVGISRTTAGDCADIGPSYPTDGQQVVGRVLSSFAPGNGRVLLFQSELHGAGGSSVTINTGAGLTGGPITSSGTISIANGGVTNAMLQNSLINVVPGTGLSGGGPASLGGSVTLSNAGVLSFNGRSGGVIAAPGDYSFAQIAGTADASQLPAATVYSNQSNTFTADQTIQGNLAASGNITAGGSVTATALSGTSANLTGAATPFSSVLAVNDTGVSGSAISVNSANNPAALFLSSGPTVFMAGKITGATTILSSNGDLTLNGTAHASAFSGDGSALTNVSATKIGTLAQSDIATNAALSTEITARQSGDTTLQNNINAETTARQTDIANVQASIGAESQARQSVEASLFSSLSAETTARQSDVSTLQTNINNVSAADAKLTASNTFTAGTQDFSGAGATLPVRSVLTANTPTACVASKELLIKTDAPAGQQLFICDDTGTTWNLVGGGGATSGVTSFNGRNGSVTPASGDYSFAQISGAAASSQLPSSVVYNNQANSFTGNQTVNGAVTATSFSGSGSALTGVNAATLNGLASANFAQLAAANTFAAKQTMAASTTASASLNVPGGSAPSSPAAGDVWNTGSTLQYRDNASTTRSLVSTTQSGGLQLLKLTASISPANIGSQTCAEQSFTVAGISTGDVLLSVLQPSTSSPGTNIAIGGFRVSAANTVAVQFCNVSRNNSTPTAGVYTFAFMR